VTPHSRIYLAGHNGLVGSALARALAARGHRDLIVASRGELDLRDRVAVRAFFARHRPQYVLLAAARVGGIQANLEFPVDFIRDNLEIQTNVIDAAWLNGARKLLFLGSSCIYPRLARQPIPESELLAGPLESSNQPYAVAKIAGITMCQAYRRQYGFDAISLMPTNLYGPGDNFHPEHSHVVPGLLRRFHEAKRAGQPEVVVWGSGTPRRELLHVDDLADAACHILEVYSAADPVNVGTGEDVTIAELAELIRAVVGYSGRIRFDASRPDGTPRKALDISRLTGLGWRARITLRAGLEQTYSWYLEYESAARH
jgi:GDP-L-fucose synthase